MGINTVQSYLRSVLDQLQLPLDLGLLTAVVTPPNPGDGTGATAYVWGSRGDESRKSVPRAEPGDLSTGGDKVLAHRTDIWLVWFGAADDPLADVRFPAIVDVVLATLRNVALVDQSQHAVDPVTGQLSQLLDVGENLSWEYAPVRATADQRWLRYDAAITVSVEEWIQA